MGKHRESTQATQWAPAADDIKLLLPQLETPRYPAKLAMSLDPRITYRRLNAWERNGLFSPKRETDKRGWRKFTFVEMVHLLIVSDLKHIGVRKEIVRHVLGWLANFPPGVPFLTVLLVTAIRGAQHVVLIERDGTPTISFNDDGILAKIRPRKAKGPVVCCPIYDYVRRVLSLSGIELESVGPHESRTLSNDEKRILEIVANDEYQRIEIIKSDGKAKTVKATGQKKGKFTANDIVLQLQAGDFRSVKATTKDGNIITLETKDTHKL